MSDNNSTQISPARQPVLSTEHGTSTRVLRTAPHIRPVYVHQPPQELTHGITADGRAWTYWIDTSGMPRATEAYHTDPDRKGSMRRYRESQAAVTLKLQAA